MSNNHCNENTTSNNKEISNKMESQSNSINNIANNNNSNNQPNIISNTNDYKQNSAEDNDYIRRVSILNKDINIQINEKYCK